MPLQTLPLIRAEVVRTANLIMEHNSVINGLYTSLIRQFPTITPTVDFAADESGNVQFATDARYATLQARLWTEVRNAPTLQTSFEVLNSFRKLYAGFGRTFGYDLVVEAAVRDLTRPTVIRLRMGN